MNKKDTAPLYVDYPQTIDLVGISLQLGNVLVNVGDLRDDWTILDNTVPFVRKDASTVQFSVPIRANSQMSTIYSIQTITQGE